MNLIIPPTGDRWTERHMLDLLNARFDKMVGNGPRYSRAEHVRSTAGFDARRICDYMAIDNWPGGYGPTAHPKLHGFEVKVSRSDWLRELKEPEKAEAFIPYCDYWSLVVSDKSIVKTGELPEGWGMLVVSGSKLRQVVSAPRRFNTAPMDRHMLACLGRAITKTEGRLALRHRAGLLEKHGAEKLAITPWLDPRGYLA